MADLIGDVVVPADAQAVIIQDRRHHAPGGIFPQQAALTVASGQCEPQLCQLCRCCPHTRRGMLRVIVIAVRGIFPVCVPAGKGGVCYQILIQWLEIAGPCQPQRLRDLLLKGVSKGRSRDAYKGQLRQRDASSGIHILLSVGLDPADPRRVATPGDNVLQREHRVIRPVAGETVDIVSRRVAEQRGKRQRTFDKVRDNV